MRTDPQGDDEIAGLEAIGESEEERFPVLRPKVPSGMVGLEAKLWREEVRKIMASSCSYGSLGGKLVSLVSQLDSPMGRFAREFSSTQPPPAVRQLFDRRGDVLPLHPSSITTDLQGVTENNLGWLQSDIHDLELSLLLWLDKTCVCPNRPKGQCEPKGSGEVGRGGDHQEYSGK